MSKNSNGWNAEAFAGDAKLGVPGAGPKPVTVKLRTCDQPDWIDPAAPPTIWIPLTRQKYVPFGNPLTLSRVAAGISSLHMFCDPCAMIVPKVELVPTCQV
jgi:hypothetical protein